MNAGISGGEENYRAIFRCELCAGHFKTSDQRKEMSGTNRAMEAAIFGERIHKFARNSCGKSLKIFSSSSLT